MASLRLLADDLTGALDSAAAFGSPASPVPVFWRGDVPAAGSAALDICTREAPAAVAVDVIRAAAAKLWRAPGAIRFKKIDSLLRGHAALEIAEAVNAVCPHHCVIAPAFPFQRRITRGGRQQAWVGEGWQEVAVDLGAALEARGHRVTLRSAGSAIPPGVSIWDAASDAGLDAIVASGMDLDDVMWIGSGGLASALARAVGAGQRAGGAALARPIVGLFGSDHPATKAQLARCGAAHLAIRGGHESDRVARRMTQGVALVSVDLAPDTPREAARTHIDVTMAALADALEPPGTLIVAGGETLRGLCDALGAVRLNVIGEIEPGVARSLMRGGRWDGITVISKSGAFGAPDLLLRLTQAAP